MLGQLSGDERGQTKLRNIGSHILRVNVAAISESGNMTLTSLLILAFDIYEWWANIVLSTHTTSAFRVGVEPQKALLLPGCGVGTTHYLVQPQQIKSTLAHL